MVWRSFLPPSSGYLEIEAIKSPDFVVNIYQTTRCYLPKTVGLIVV
jgi:hypothetical protein